MIYPQTPDPQHIRTEVVRILLDTNDADLLEWVIKAQTRNMRKGVNTNELSMLGRVFGVAPAPLNQVDELLVDLEVTANKELKP